MVGGSTSSERFQPWPWAQKQLQENFAAAKLSNYCVVGKSRYSASISDKDSMKWWQLSPREWAQFTTDTTDQEHDRVKPFLPSTCWWIQCE